MRKVDMVGHVARMAKFVVSLFGKPSKGNDVEDTSAERKIMSKQIIEKYGVKV
jgi:hypothetical protein